MLILLPVSARGAKLITGVEREVRARGTKAVGLLRSLTTNPSQKMEATDARVKIITESEYLIML